jgi:murein DD-endopeptidase MepM/ murein hydrolase activator NlpD
LLDLFQVFWDFYFRMNILMLRNLLITFITLLYSITIIAQNNKTDKEDTRSANRRFADSMYAVHTLKKTFTNTKKIDTSAINKKREKIPSIYIKDKKDLPSATLYQNTWFNDRVKMSNFSLRDVPDEVVIRLLGKNNKEKFCFPYKGHKTSGYAWRWGRPHTGLDIGLNTGDPIHAAFDGVVRIARYNGGYGNMVLIRHYNNLETLYGHMSELKVKVGQVVKAGDVIGLGGSTGHSTGPHLHFECRCMYACFDPEWIVDLNSYKLKTKIIKLNKSYFGIAPSEEIANKRTQITKLAKINRCLTGTSFVSKNQLNKMIQKKEIESNKPVMINNNDKTTWRYYIVKKDDTLESLSERFRVTKEDLMKINNFKDASQIKEKEKIRIR